MMRIKQVVALFLVSGVLSLSVNGQNEMPLNKNLPNIMSPEVSSLGKYGTYDVNMYSGIPSISVPFHEIKENGISIPLAISYDASGFMPNKNASEVGLNWNLTAGGAIVRSVNGEPDDSYSTVSDPFGNNKGYIYARLHGQQPNYTSEYIRTIGFLPQSSTLSSPNGQGCCPNGASSIHAICYNPSFNLTYEYQPDIFSFNFLGHAGKFFMDNNGQIQVSSDKRYKVDLSGLAPVYNFQNILLSSSVITAQTLENNSISVIKITSDDGYEFTFGGRFKELEVQFSYGSPFDIGVSPTSGVINAWYLTKVKTPEGAIINFKYKSYTEDEAAVINNLFTNQPSSIDNIPAGFLEVKIMASQRRIYQKKGGSVTSENHTVLTSKALVKHCYLEEINSELFTAKFFYNEKDQVNKFYQGDIYGYSLNGQVPVLDQVNKNLNYHTQKLYKIELYDVFNGGGIPDGFQPFANSKTILFGYVNKAGTATNRLFLDNVSINGLSHKFTYSNSDNLPAPYTLGIDIWGYYNGQTANTDLVGDPGVPFGIPGEFEVDLQSPGRDRRPYAAFAAYGMLKTIEYPTGGITEFTFENHDYGKILKRKVSSGIVPVWEAATGITGGLRIKEIKNTPGTTSTYKYLLNYEQGTNGGSSGLLVKNEIYKTDYFDAVNDNVQRIITDNNISGAASFSAPYIGYKEVVEINSEGFIKYEFTNHESNPDTYFHGNDSYTITNDQSSSQSNFNNQLKRLFRYSSREDERGKLKKRAVYNASNTIVASTEYTYNTDPQRDQAKTFAVFVPHNLRVGTQIAPCTFLIGAVHSYALYYYHNLATSITEKDYSNNPSVPLVTQTTMQYKSNTNPLLTQKTVTQSDGTVLKYQYEYPEDYPSVQPYADMVTLKNILTPVVKETISKNSTVLFVNKHNYGLFNSNIYRIISEKQVNQVVSPNQEDGLMTALQYSQRGMIEEARKDNNHLLAYLWDYKGQYPVAKVANAAYASIGYASFEADGNGRWTFQTTGTLYNYSVPAGKRCYKLSGSNTLVYNYSAFSAHIVSYWSKNGQYNVSGTSAVTQGATINGWTVFEHEVSGVSSVSITGTGLIDEVRIYPKGALMTTYTYEPLSGITSQCDPNNRIVYYEYDIMGRLVVIRDQDRNIVKRYCYNLYGQTENCAMETGATWTQTGETRCKPCTNNPSQVTNIFQRQYLDVNPQSATYNQLTWIDDPTNTSCTASSTAADWQNIGTPVCQKQPATDVNTGYVEQQQQDMNTCSATYGQTQTVLIYNPTLCPPPPCGPGNCSGDDKKCINGVCETGTWSVVSSVYISKNNWQCTWAYCFSDGSTSIYTQTTSSTTACTITCL